jgi:hypothetical protein
MAMSDFTYKGFVVTVETRTVLLDHRQGWTWGKKKTLSTFRGYNPETNESIRGSGAKLKARAAVDALKDLA